LLEADVAKRSLAAVVEMARTKGFVFDEHFTVDGTLLEAWASTKSFQPKEGKNALPPDDPGNPTVNFRGQRRSNETHASKTDPEAKLARKGERKESKLSYSGNLLVENRNGLIVDATAWEANGRAERDAALVMLEQVPGDRRITVGGDKGFDSRYRCRIWTPQSRAQASSRWRLRELRQSLSRLYCQHPCSRSC
jgi:hypothetical protein